LRRAPYDPAGDGNRTVAVTIAEIVARTGVTRSSHHRHLSGDCEEVCMLAARQDQGKG
jgi:hypothetical protein